MRFPTVSSMTNLQNLCHKINELSFVYRWKEVLTHYKEIRKVGYQLIDHTIYSHVLKACLACSSRLGQSVHASLSKQGFDSFISVGNSLTDFYAKSGALCSAFSVFDSMKKRDSVSWNTILHGHLDQGFLEEGVDLFIQARLFGFESNISTLVLVIQAYQTLQAFDDGQKFHGYLIRSGLWSLTSVQNSLLGMYAANRMDYAETLFDEMYEKDVISWSVMIRGYVHVDDNVFALESFKQMISEFGVEPDGQTMVSVLKGCTQLGELKTGKLIHGYVVSRGLRCDLFVGNTIIDLYCKCGDIDSAITAFWEMPYRNIVSWNSLLSGLVRNEKHAESLNFFASMEKSGLDADEVTLVNLLLVCKVLGDLHQCKLIHSRIIRRGFYSNELAVNSLVDTYAKCNQIDLSWRLFGQINTPDIVTWSTMISAFTHCGLPDEAISLYRQMRLSQERLNPVTLLNLLEACALSAEIGRSKCAHGIAIRMGLASHVAVGTSVLDMYSKCGAIEASRRAFDQISTKNVVSWSAIIAAYGLNGLPHDAVALLPEMEAHGVKPNSVTILAVLSACCHGGLIDEGLTLSKDIVKKHGAELKLEHYSCLVDLLARAGKLEDAFQLIKSIPAAMKPGASAWGALLSACRTYENRKLTEGALPQIFELEPSSSAGYLLASNTFAAGGSWTDASGIRCLMKERGVKVVAGYSMVHVGKNVHTFTAGDKCHLLSNDSYMFGPVVEQLHSCMTIDPVARIQVP
ncbi:pentatricopeptide repeat-containing protein [Salvia divinorum]|uniref:Pentatricopeptide repeat-containing protein n=1 Tax=Salvia divinorum TaxID=28513 RepID=A0ABD1FU16_SALDI